MKCSIHNKDLVCLSCQAAKSGSGWPKGKPRKKNKRIQALMQEHGCTRQWAYELIKQQKQREKDAKDKLPRPYEQAHKLGKPNSHGQLHDLDDY